MKKTVKAMLIAAMAMCVTMVNAQAPEGGPKAPKNPEEMAQKMADNLKNQLGLNDEQTARVKALNLEMNKKIEAAKVDGKVDKETRMAIMKEHNEALQKVLTPEQFTKLQEIRKEQMQKGHGPAKPGDGKGKGPKPAGEPAEE